MGWFNTKLRRGAYHLGGFIALYTKSVIFTFGALSFFLSIGISHYVYVNDVEYLYTVSNGQSKQERAVVEELFPFNATHRFDISRLARFGRLARVIIMEKNEENLLRADLWKEIQELDSEIRNLTIEYENVKWNYNDLCVKWFEDCYLNEFLDVGEVLSDFEMGKTRLSYPVFFNPKTLKAHPLAPYFGGVNISNDGFSILAVKTVMLNYFITEEDIERGMKWESSFLDWANKRNQSSKRLKLNYFALRTIPDEIEENIKSCFIPFMIAIALVLLYIIFSTTSSSDWVKSKPILAVMGAVSGLLAVLAAVGILCYFQIPIIGLSTSIPFILLAIGIDDTFVMLSVWRTTSPRDPVPKRMAECYSEAVVSITITSLTDMFSFYIGIFTPIPCIQIYCWYAGTGILCIFIWQIFFFGACLAISGYQEAENKHSVFWWIKATPRSKSENLSWMQRVLFSGGVEPSDLDNSKDVYVDKTSVFFRDTFAPLLGKKWVQAFVLSTFLVYLCISSFGVMHLQEGLAPDEFVRYDSYMAEFYRLNDKYFAAYPFRLQLIISNQLDYSEKSNQIKIQRMLETFYEDPNMSDEFNENWLNSFLTFIDRYKDLANFNISTESSFIKILREEFLRERSPLSLDVVFNEDHTKIISSRFIIQTKHVPNLNVATESVKRYRLLAEDFNSQGLNVTIYNPWFHFVDQFVIIRELTLKLLLVATIIVMMVTALLIPSFICCLCVLFSILSIEFGVVGFMALWGVDLDLISVTCIVMCVGFSVDFASHVSYAYVGSSADSPEGKIRDCLFCLGKPVVQGAVSTLLAVAPLLTIPSYVFLTNCKIVILIIVFAIAHALVLLPVFLSVFQTASFVHIVQKKSKTYSVSKESNVRISEIVSENEARYTRKTKEECNIVDKLTIKSC